MPRENAWVFYQCMNMASITGNGQAPAVEHCIQRFIFTLRQAKLSVIATRIARTLPTLYPARHGVLQKAIEQGDLAVIVGCTGYITGFPTSWVHPRVF